jgi:hypothetical protein
VPVHPRITRVPNPPKIQPVGVNLP